MAAEQASPAPLKSGSVVSMQTVRRPVGRPAGHFRRPQTPTEAGEPISAEAEALFRGAEKGRPPYLIFGKRAHSWLQCLSANGAKQMAVYCPHRAANCGASIETLTKLLLYSANTNRACRPKRPTYRHSSASQWLSFPSAVTEPKLDCGASASLLLPPPPLPSQ